MMGEYNGGSETVKFEWSGRMTTAASGDEAFEFGDEAQAIATAQPQGSTETTGRKTGV